MTKGLYNISVSAAGYKTFHARRYVAGNITLYAPLIPENAVKVKPPPGSNSTLPPVRNGSDIYYPLEIKVLDKDWYPVENASVYINGSLAGFTDSDGHWYRYFKANVTLEVAVSYKTWNTTKNITLDKPILAIFKYNGSLGIALDEVAVYDVFVFDRKITVPNTIGLVVMVYSTKPQNVTVMAGLADVNGTPVASVNKTTYVYTGATPVFLTVPVNKGGRLIPFARIVSYQYDTNATNNEVYATDNYIMAFKEVTLWLIIRPEVVDTAGLPLIYPGKTKFNYRIGIRSTRDVDFMKEINGSLAVTVAIYNYMPVTGNKTALIKTFNVTRLKRGDNYFVNVTVPCPFARAVYLVENVKPVNIPDFMLSVQNGTYLVVIPPHYIVQSVDVPKTVMNGNEVKIKIKAWTNEEPPVYVWAYLNLSGNVYETQKRAASSATHTLSLTTKVSVKNNGWIPGLTTPAYMYNGQLVVMPSLDSYLEDNIYEVNVTVLNTTSWLFWILLAIIAIIVAMLVLAFAHIIAHSSADLAALESKYLEPNMDSKYVE